MEKWDKMQSIPAGAHAIAKKMDWTDNTFKKAREALCLFCRSKAFKKRDDGAVRC